MIRFAIIGYGTIAREQHLPALTGHGGYDLKAVVTSGEGPAGVPAFPDTDALLAALGHDLDAVAISTPPGPRYVIARQCLAAGLDVMLEKPPTATLGEIEDLRDDAAARGSVLFTTWHSQHAAAVDQVRVLLSGQRIAAMRIHWHEDVNTYHPGQDWVWEAGGFGVFDPGINALSIASRIVPGRLIVREALLDIPANRQQPIRVRLRLASPAADGAIEALFDWTPTDRDEWTIAVRLGDGREILLGQGGAALAVDGEARPATGPGEYPALYAAFATAVAERRSVVDIEPLRIVADALMTARRTTVPDFHWRKA